MHAFMYTYTCTYTYTCIFTYSFIDGSKRFRATEGFAVTRGMVSRMKDGGTEIMRIFKSAQDEAGQGASLATGHPWEIPGGSPGSLGDLQWIPRRSEAVPCFCARRGSMWSGNARHIGGPWPAQAGPRISIDPYLYI